MKHLRPINYRTIPHKKQRYDSAGDYWTKNNGFGLNIDEYRVSILPQGWRAELAVFVHEMVEFELCKEAGIKEEDITKFDIESGHPDPGTLKESPYYDQHKIATKIEKYIIKQLGLDWKEYDANFDKLTYKNK